MVVPIWWFWLGLN